MKLKAKLRVCVEIRGLSRTTIMMMIIIIIYIGSYKIKVTDKEHLVCMHI